MFQLTELPFAQDALAPVMSADTLATHHGKHHAAYVNKTNALLAEKNLRAASLEEVVRQSAKDDRALFNQSAQAWNHSFFWNCLSPKQQPAPKGALGDAVAQHFGSHEAFREKFLAQGAAHFASGWIWLSRSADGALSLTTTPNAETPITEQGVRPILVCDLWEHAYYLDYKNERPKFLNGFIDRLVNWELAARQFEDAQGWSYPAPRG